jgi:hypothetical protein
MPKSVKLYNNFNRGYNDTTLEDNLLEEELYKAENILLSTRGGYKKRAGCINAQDTKKVATPIYKLLKYKTNTVSKYLGFTNKALVEWTPTALTTLISGLASDFISYQFFTNSKLYFVDGANYYVYDGTTVAAVTPAAGTVLDHIKRCTLIIQRGQRMFAAGDPQNPNTVYYSEIGSPNNFPVSNAVNAITDDGDKITALSVFNDILIVFKENNIYTWQGYDPTSDVHFELLLAHSGTVSPDSIVVTDNYLIYLGRDAVLGLKVSEDTFGIDRLSAPIPNTIASIAKAEACKGVYYRGKYMLSCSTVGNHYDIILVGYLSLIYSAPDDVSGQSKIVPWTIFKGWKASSWFEDTDGTLYFGNWDGYIAKAFVGTSDFGQAIVMKVMHRLNLSNALKTKKVRAIIIMVNQEVSLRSNAEVKLTLNYVTQEYDIDFNEGMIWGLTAWGASRYGTSDMVKKEILVNESCDRLNIEIVQNEKTAYTDNDLTVYGIGVVFRSKKVKGHLEGVTSV